MNNSERRKAIFLTHPNSINFDSEISGGVQLCSREFYKLIELMDFDLHQVNVNYTRNIVQRLMIKAKFGLYSMFNVKKDVPNILREIREKDVEYVFINMASLLRYAKPIKQELGDKVKIFLLSHGNDSGDFLHLITKPISKKYKLFSKIRDVIRLGILIQIESLNRNYYLDGVFSVSDTEREIENWFGAKKSIYVPRTINKAISYDLNTDYSKVGFIGRLDHPPNYQGVTMVLDELVQLNVPNLNFRLIGAPSSWGEKIAKKYPFVTYLGELTDTEVDQEVSTWAMILNTVFWYSTGVTTKFAKCLEWGVPTITTKQGTRGYQWEEGELNYVNSPKEMAEMVAKNINNPDEIERQKKELGIIKNSSFTLKDLSEVLKKELVHV